MRVLVDEESSCEVSLSPLLVLSVLSACNESFDKAAGRVGRAMPCTSSKLISPEDDAEDDEQ